MLADDGTQGLTRKVIGIAISIHRKYGPGLLEKAYRDPFVFELRAAGHEVDCDRQIKLVHESLVVDSAYRPDIVIDERLMIEVKSVAAIVLIHRQQLRTYMRLAGIKVGLLINFNVPILRHGIRRELI
jgi:GxxExxY protein